MQPHMMNQRAATVATPLGDNDPWRRSPPMTNTAEDPGFSFAGGKVGAMDHRRSHSRSSSDWDSRNSRNGGYDCYSQKTGSVYCAHSRTVAAEVAAVHSREIDMQRNGQFSFIGRTTPHLINSGDSTHENSNRRNNSFIPTRIARAPKHRAKQDLPGPAGAWFRQQKRKTTRQKLQHHDVSNTKMKMAALASVSDKSTAVNSKHSKEDDDYMLAQPVACTSNSAAQNMNNEVGGRRVEQKIITQPLPIMNSNPLQQEQLLHSLPSKTIGQDEIDSPSPPSPNNCDDNTHSKRQQQQSLFHDHSSDLHECNAWNVMCKTLDRIVPPLNHVLLSSSFSSSSLSLCREMTKCDKGTIHAPSLSSSYSSVAAYYKNILRTNIPDNYALIYEIHAGKYDVCRCFDSAVSSSVDGDSAVLHTDELRIPLLVGYVASVQCHAHSDWTALLVDEMFSVGTNSKGNGGCRSSGSINASRGILCWIEERLVKQHPNFIRPGAVWMLEGAKLALFTSACEDDEDYDNTATAMGTDASPSTDNARRRAGVIDRVILAGESSLIYAWTPEEAAPAFTDEEFVSLTERRFNLVLPQEVEDGLIGMVEKKSCLGAVTCDLDQPGHVNTAQPAELADNLSLDANETSDVRTHSENTELREINLESDGDELLMLMHLSHQDVGRCHGTTHNVDGASFDDHGSMKIAQATEPPCPLPLRSSAKAEATILSRPTIRGSARPVTSESIPLMPPDHDYLDDGSSVHEVGEDIQHENSNQEAHCPEPRLDNSLEDSRRNENISNSTDIAQTSTTNQGGIQLEIRTGNDSFDDMLDEEFVFTPYGTNLCQSTVTEVGTTIQENEKNDMPSQQLFPSTMNGQISHAASGVLTTHEASLLFDSLDGDDLDCLSEED